MTVEIIDINLQIPSEFLSTIRQNFPQLLDEQKQRQLLTEKKLKATEQFEHISDNTKSVISVQIFSTDLLNKDKLVARSEKGNVYEPTKIYLTEEFQKLRSGVDKALVLSIIVLKTGTAIKPTILIADPNFEIDMIQPAIFIHELYDAHSVLFNCLEDSLSSLSRK